MRSRDYRRKQEAKHFKKRLDIAVSIGRFSSAETGYQPMYAGKNNMYRIEKAGCPKGWAYVVDYMGNRCYYGSIADCKEFIKAMEGV